MASEEQKMKEEKEQYITGVAKTRELLKVKNKIGAINIGDGKKSKKLLQFLAGLFKLIGSNPACCSSLCLAQTLETDFYMSFPISFWHLACSCIGLGLQRSEENGFLIKLLHTRVQKLSHNVMHNEN